MQSVPAILCSQWSGAGREPYSYSDGIALLQGYGTYVPELQALVYDILPSTTAIFSYAIGSRKQSANEQFLVGAQTTQIISVCFITVHAAYSSSDKTKIINRDGTLFFTRGGCALCLRACLGTRLLLPSQTFRRVLTASVDSCAEIMSASSVA